MSTSTTVTFANIVRRQQGQMLVELFGEFVTMKQRQAILDDMAPEQIAAKNMRLRHIREEEEMIREHKEKAAIFPIMDLPFDLRTIVLRHTLESDTVEVLSPRRNSPFRGPIPLPVTTRLNRQLRLETLRLFLLNTTIDFTSAEELATWLSSLNFTSISENLRDGFDAVKRLLIGHIGRCRCPYHLSPNPSGRSSQIILASACRNLQELTITFWTCAVGGRGRMKKNAAQLRQEYCLDTILQLKELEVLRLTGSGARNTAAEFSELKTWFECEFRKKIEAGERVKPVLVKLPGEE